MKALLIAAMMTMVLLAGVSLVFRLRPSPHRVRQLVLVYLCCLGLAAVIWFGTPADLWILGRPFQTEPAWLDFLVMLFFFSAAFFGGVLQLYNLADRGFSLRILLDIDVAPDGMSDAGRLVKAYGGGQGLDWMYRKRIDGLFEQALVRREGDAIILTDKGRRAAELFLAARQFLRLEPRP